MSENTLLQKHFAHLQKEEERLEKLKLEAQTENYNLILTYLTSGKFINQIEDLLISHGRVVLYFECVYIPSKVLKDDIVIHTQEEVNKYVEKWNEKGVHVDVKSDELTFTLEGLEDMTSWTSYWSSRKIMKSKVNLIQFKKEL